MKTTTMRPLYFCLAAFCLSLPLFARERTPEQRLQDEEALQRVYYSHQTGATQPFEQAVGRQALERKVETTLELGAALEKFWKTRITEEMLDRELLRMERQTRMPERLLELYRALDNDPARIRESLARPLLAQRLARNFFDFDKSIHQDSRRSAEALHRRLLERWIDPASPHARRTTVHFVRSEDSPSSTSPAAPGHAREGLGVWVLDPEEFETWTARTKSWSGGISSLVEERDAFFTRVLLKESSKGIDIAIYTTPKRSWEDWWSEVELNEKAVPAPEIEGPGGGWSLESPAGIPGVLAPEAPCSPDGSWSVLSEGDAPEPRSGFTMVWTGSLVLMWGGTGDQVFNSGGRYDPATDTWAPISIANGPGARSGFSAVWTGSRMIVWGGSSGTYLNSGGRYDPVTDTWTPTSTANAPAGRTAHSAVWTGSEMIVWGGNDQTIINGKYLQTGGRYNPATDSWMTTSTTNAPTGRNGHAAVWTGNHMIVWGGFDNSGGRYDPITDSWQPTSLTNAPEGRRDFTGIWTGAQMIVWGGSGGSSPWLNTGGRYDPVLDTWSATSTSNAPVARYGHVAVWAGSRMIVWGGRISGGDTDTGGLYNPSTNSWTPTSTANAPSGRASTSAVWTDARMVVWGGLSGSTYLNSGGRYDPTSDSWTPTSGADIASPRRFHTGVWTGSELLIWGGNNGVAPLNTGVRFDPATAVWTPITLAGAPAARYSHTAVWTGSAMIIWGGAQTSSTFLDSGGRYDPNIDSWAPVTTSEAPAPRYQHTAVWTGSKMIVWGGHIAGADADTGGLYDPTADVWVSTSPFGAPSARSNHVAVWSGTRMLVWGGVDNSGGLYDPAGNSWTPTSLTGAPAGRQYATAVWTGTKMIVWGGSVGNNLQNTGGRYDPLANLWSPTSTTLAPSRRRSHTAVWTGNLMLVWGGLDNFGSTFTNSGGRYEPVTDTWSPIPTANAPVARYDHSANWLGDQMLVWGGIRSANLASRGGLYCTCASAGYFRDFDGDGFGDKNSWVHACSQPAGYVTNGSDCNDSFSEVWALPGELSNLVFQDDTTMAWDASADPGATSVFYDAIRSDDPANFFFPSAFCILDAGVSPNLSDAQQPAPGATFNYLVRARNNCPIGYGPLGYRSDGTPRTALNCP